MTGSKTTPCETSESTPIQGEVIRVTLIKDNRLVREALVAVLNRSPDIEVVADAPNGEELLMEDGPMWFFSTSDSRTGTACGSLGAFWRTFRKPGSS